MDLSIVIVSWNTRELLRGCLASLPAATAGLDTEIIVVDNASADGSAELVVAEFPHARLMDAGGNLGFARANNLAIPHTLGRCVLLLNPDTVCPPGSLTRLFRFLSAKEGAAAAGPRLVDGAGRPTITWGFFPRARDHWLGCLDPRRLWLRGPLARRVTVVPERHETSRPVEYALGACLMITRPALTTVGLLDDRFFLYFEETDWCWRARGAGLTVWYCAETEVTHLEGQAAARAGGFTQRQFQKSYRLFVAKNYGRGRVWQFRLAQFAEYGLKALLRRLAPGDGNRALATSYWGRARMQLWREVEAVPPG